LNTLRWARIAVGPEETAQLAPVAVLLLATLLHAGSLPAWCLIVIAGMVAWRVATILRAAPRVSHRRLVRSGFALAALGALLAVFATFRTVNGLAAGSALLALMGALKMLETHSRRDELIVIAVALFLLLAACLASQELTRAPLYALVAWAACAAIALVAQRSREQSIAQALRIAGRALLLAIPVAIVFFLFFPRVAGQFWALPGGGTATTGLGEEMAPTSIDRLIENYEPAFRVSFATNPPAPNQRYWRGPVLTQFDGFTWRRSPGAAYREPPLELLGPPVRHTVTLEPSSSRWWFALETVAESPQRGVFLTPDRQLIALEPVGQTVSYQAVSHLSARPRGTLSPLARRITTKLPGNRNRRSLALATELRVRHADDRAFATAVLEYFRTQGFEYSLEPPRTTIDAVDDFLFETRLGFCGHYASAFTTLMRAGGVPARVVTGYLGGEWNPIGGYLIVRHSDAHAWSEIWLDESGWTRIDPTGVVEPERLTRGVIDLLPEAMSAPTRVVHNWPWLARIALAWDGANHWWRQNVVEFDIQSQLALLDRIGLGDAGWRGLGIALAIGFIAWMIAIALSLRRVLLRARPDRLARLWLQFCSKAARLAPERAAAEAPLQFAHRVGAARPELAAAARDIAERYCALRFGRTSGTARDGSALAALARAIRDFAA
jgi:transglutaminase-like putative cysteine protease